ncbi:dolichyl-phosphate beta-glucosyltransferase [Coemansia spiralis]|uniref:dolichyl-phosphate beta-glucosyltransferase n=2 Tax=Coemansia TaxID=4863 RepID=A0A9W8G267_9FUNG|nr:Alg5-prov protein [Coemansia spiralis]KAJ1992026.1 dolichyl-phosphate beta-glucosyltransferase [Coemansia umbellata]KAJ2621347.1 dolichyl-phosphate beta-glucosyltransferase [Coemansia sp. RSA 1358]KAJ2670893.1 dolichyl-phosphate beta-glucosyltransferase [Coemansia spiralis]
MVVRFKSPKPRKREDSENYFECIDEKNERQRLGSLEDKASVELSIVVPAYNEEERLPVLLNDVLAYVQRRREKEKGFSFELIVMDDGSRDKTSEVALEFARKHNMCELKVVRHTINRGKGGAVTQGVLSAMGRRILFCDADGATRFSDIDALLGKTTQTSIAIGSRNNQALGETVVERSHIRAFLQWGFHTYVTILGVRGVRDTQCGFKLFGRQAARQIFPNMHVERFIFDIEILLLARYQGIPVTEVPVNWHEVAGSKMSIVRDSIQMALDLLAVRLNYLLGNWKINAEPRQHK